MTDYTDTVGCSEIPVLMLGKHFSRTPVDLYLEKIGERPPVVETDAMRLGKLLEPYVLEDYGRMLGSPNLEHAPDRLLHAEQPYLRASLDAMASVNGHRWAVEIKTSSRPEEWGEHMTDQAPEGYRIQVQGQLEVADLDQADMPVLFVPRGFRESLLSAPSEEVLRELVGMFDMRVYRFRRDRDYGKKILQAVAAFRLCVETRTPPEPKALGDAAKLYPRSDPSRSLTADDELLEITRHYVLAREERKQAEKAEKAIKNMLQERMGTARVLVSPEGRDLVRWDNPSALDVEDLRQKEPEMYDAYCRIFDAKAFRKEHPDAYETFLSEGRGPRKMQPTKWAEEMVEDR